MNLIISDIIKISESIETINKLNINIPVNIGVLLLKNKNLCDSIINNFLNECETKFNNLDKFDSSNEEYNSMLNKDVDIKLFKINLSDDKYYDLSLPLSVISGLIPIIN